MLCKFIILIFCSVCFLFYSCAGSNEVRIQKILDEWRGKEVKFPVNMVFSTLGKDTLNDCFVSKSKYTIVTYIDSVGCVRCHLNLIEWKYFIEQIKKYSLDCKILIFIHPRSHREVISLLKNENFDYPVCIDIKDSINKLNHFPLDMNYQTFLLDENNKVLAIGNPIYNFRIQELYLKIMKGENMSSASRLKTKIMLDEENIDIGPFDWRREQTAQFSLTNLGEIPFLIEKVSTSCGCTTIEYTKEPISPQMSTILKVKYKAEHPGYFEKTITVYCNVENSLFKLKISGKAR